MPETFPPMPLSLVTQGAVPLPLIGPQESVESYKYELFPNGLDGLAFFLYFVFTSYMSEVAFPSPDQLPFDPIR